MERPNADDFTYRFLEESDLPALSRLIRSMSKGTADGLEIRDNSQDYYRWMYFRNPAGDAIVASAWDGDKLVSSFAIAPKRLKTGSGEHTYGKTMDMFTDPDYQGLRIMSRLTKTVFQEAIRRGIDHWYVTPSGNSYPIFKNKWGYVEPFELVYRAMILDAAALAGAITGNGLKRLATRVSGALLAAFPGRRRAAVPPAGAVVEEVREFPAEMDDFWRTAGPGYGVALVRDARYLNWRYVENPDDYRISLYREDGAIKGYLVSKVTVRRGIKVGDVVDLFYPAGEKRAGRAMLDHAVAFFRREGCALAETWDYEGCPNGRLYRETGIRLKRATYKFLLSPGGSDRSYYDSGSWYVMQGDGNDI